MEIALLGVIVFYFKVLIYRLLILHMQKLRLKINNYKAINEADIFLNGITVLAGENGCGKSTISRNLYYFINSIGQYNDYVFEEYVEEMSSLVKILITLFRSIGESKFDKSHILATTSLLRDFDDYSKYNDVDIDDIHSKFINVASDFFIDLKKYWNTSISDGEKMRIILFMRKFNDSVDDLEIKKLDIEKECDNFLSQIDIYKKSVKEKVSCRTKKMLYDIILKNYDAEDLPNDIQLKEFEEDILDNSSFRDLSSLSSAIFIDTPMYLSNSFALSQLGVAIRKMMFKERGKMSSNCKKTFLRIQRILNGSVQLDNDELDDEYSLNYYRKDGLVVQVADTATGFKSFIYIQRLLENGYLDKNTLLIIDEPEAHLHPQWIVEFAKLLVLLNKEVGVKILIASHNSDMVSAIQAIAKHEAVLDNVTFYQAVQSDIPYKYNYKNLGQDISEIFKSYNIAISKLSHYE